MHDVVERLRDSNVSNFRSDVENHFSAERSSLLSSRGVSSGLPAIRPISDRRQSAYSKKRGQDDFPQ